MRTHSVFGICEYEPLTLCNVRSMNDMNGCLLLFSVDPPTVLDVDQPVIRGSLAFEVGSVKDYRQEKGFGFIVS